MTTPRSKEEVHAEKVAEYTELLKTHNWMYTYHDEYARWKEGSEERADIIRLQREVDKDYKIWNEHAPKGHRIDRREV